MRNAFDAKKALLSQVVGREVIQLGARVLVEAGIPVMPLKGVWLQACVYPDLGDRAITDVDLLVPEDAFKRAVELLGHAGWRANAAYLCEISFTHADLALPIDLHRSLFQRGAFNLPTRDLFARSRPDTETFGVGLHMPAPLDVFAHLVGHFVKSRTRRDDSVRLADFTILASRFNLDPIKCAQHLAAAGMARAARYVLEPLAEEQRHGPFMRDVLLALPRDVAAERVVALANLIAHQSRSSGIWGALPGFLLERSLPHAARSLLLRLIDRQREPLREH